MEGTGRAVGGARARNQAPAHGGARGASIRSDYGLMVDRAGFRDAGLSGQACGPNGAQLGGNDDCWSLGSGRGCAGAGRVWGCGESVGPGVVPNGVAPDVPSDHAALAAGPISLLAPLWAAPGLRRMLSAAFAYAGPRSSLDEPTDGTSFDKPRTRGCRVRSTPSTGSG